MPRRDVYVEAERARLHTLDPEADWMPPYRLQAASVPEPTPHSPSYRSGFWGYAELPGVEVPETAELGLRGTIDGGGMAQRSLGGVTLLPSLDTEPLAVPSAADGAAEPLVAICMATFNPRIESSPRRCDSIQAQAHRNWVCVISDDDSREEVQAEIARLVADDPRFVFRRGNAPARLLPQLRARAGGGPARRPSYVALADQDDRWYPEKLEAADVDRRRPARLQRHAGRRRGRRGDERHLLGPPAQQPHRHRLAADHEHGHRRGVAVSPRAAGPASSRSRRASAPEHSTTSGSGLVALARGSLGYVDGRSTTTSSTSAGARAPVRVTARATQGFARRALRLLYGQRGIYFGDFCRLQVVGAIAASALRAGDGSAQAQQVGQANVATEVDRRPGAGSRCGRCGAPAPAAPRFGEERKLLRAVAWPRQCAALARTDRRPATRSTRAFRNRFATRSSCSAQTPPESASCAGRSSPLELRVSADGARAGQRADPGDRPAAASSAATSGSSTWPASWRSARAPVRLVCFERDFDRAAADWRRQVESYSGLAGLVRGRRGRPSDPAADQALAASPADRFVATTWWSAHVADARHRASSAASASST